MKRIFSALRLLAGLLIFFTTGFGETSHNRAQSPQTSAQTVDSAAALSYLSERLDAIIQSAGLINTRKSLCVYSIDNQTTYYDRQSKTALTPASTTKLFSTFTAFDRLGPNGTISTNLFTDAPNIENGVVRGNLYVVGHGDALLSINDIETLADKLVSLGINKIEGFIYADGTYFDEITERHIYSGDGEIVEPLPPITALGMNRNSVSVMVSPGNPPRAQTMPPSDAFRIVISNYSAPEERRERQSVVKINASKPIRRKSRSDGMVKISPVKPKSVPAKSGKLAKKKTPPGSRRKQTVVAKRQAKRRVSAILQPISSQAQRFGDAAPAPMATKLVKRKTPMRRVSVQSKANDAGVQEFYVSGSVGRGGMYSTSFIMKNPDIAVAGALRNRLVSGGIMVGGGVGRRAKPEHASELAVFERPIVEMCAAVNKNSDNFLAEHVFKMIGAHAGGQKNTAKRATEVVKERLEKEKIYSEGLCMADGSGLCRKNLIAAATEAGLLDKAAKLFGGKFESTLAIAGVDGTLRKRMKFTKAEGNVRAKTGTLRNASALAGYARTADGERLAFSFIFNGGSVGLYKQTENKLAETLAEFSYTASKPPENNFTAPALKTSKRRAPR